MVNIVYNPNKMLPTPPRGQTVVVPDITKQLQMIDESFEDITLDVEIEKLQSKMLERYRSPKSRRTQKLLLLLMLMLLKQYHHHHQQHLQQQQQQQVSPVKEPIVVLTPSQKLRVRRKRLNDELESSIRHEQEMSTSKNKDIDSLSDDELPDDFIVYNVPLSKSLKALSSKEQIIMNQPFVNNYVPHSFSLGSNTSSSLRTSSLSDSNRSSVFSYKSTLSNMTDDNLSSDLKFFTIEMNRNIEMIQNEESQQRIFHLKRMMIQQNQSRDSVYSVSSQSSLVSETTSKYLSNTRPNNLPPKDKFESLKHLKDYESMLSSALRQEQDRCHSQEHRLKLAAKQRSKDLKEWIELSSNLKENLSKTSTRELWWRGIPLELRPKIWCEQIGNKLQIEESTVVELFNKVGSSNVDILKKVNLYCFPNLAIFNNSEVLVKIISSYLRFTGSSDKDIGLYSLSATLLHNIKNPIKTFIALCNVLHRKLSYSFINDIHDEYRQSQVASFDKIFTRKLNRLSTNFKIYQLKSEEFLKPLCSYCLTQYMELSKCSMLMDIYLFEGDSFLLRCVLGFLKKIDYKLFGNKEEIMKILDQDCLINLNLHLFKDESNELIYGFKYLDLGFDEEFFKGVRNILRD